MPAIVLALGLAGCGSKAHGLAMPGVTAPAEHTVLAPTAAATPLAATFVPAVDYPPRPQATTKQRNCDSAYSNVCLHDGIGDHDCAGGSGNGTHYVQGPVTVVEHPDPFGLDTDRDGVGCE